MSTNICKTGRDEKKLVSDQKAYSPQLDFLITQNVTIK